MEKFLADHKNLVNIFSTIFLFTFSATFLILYVYAYFNDFAVTVETNYYHEYWLEVIVIVIPAVIVALLRLAMIFYKT